MHSSGLGLPGFLEAILRVLVSGLGLGLGEALASISVRNMLSILPVVSPCGVSLAAGNFCLVII